MRVLIVDDSETNRMLLQNTLAAEGMEVLEAEDGLQALQLLKREPVDAVISDILMPKMDGYRLCEAIRKSNKLHGLPFVVYSATYLSDSDQKLALRVGVDKFITKPAPGKEFVQIIQEVLASAESPRRKVRKAEKRRELFPLKQYTAAVVRKLEETNAELTSANATLTERVTLASFASEVSSALTQVENLREMLQRCAEAIVGRLHVASARIWIFNPRENVLELQASAGIDAPFESGQGRVAVGQSTAGLIAQQRAPILANPVVGDPRVREQRWAKREGLVACAGYPLLVDNRLVGVMVMFAGRPLSDAFVQAMASVANDTAVGIQRKLAEERARQHFNRIRALHEIDAAISSTLELREVLHVLLEKIDLFLPFSSATTLRLRNPATDEVELLACRNIEEEEWRGPTGQPLSSRAKKVLETKSPMIVRNVQTDPETINPAIYAKYGLVTYAGLPMLVKGEAIGVLGVYTKQEHAFSDEEVEFLSALAAEAAIAIHNAQLYEQTKKQAAALEKANDDLKRREEIQRFLKELSQDITTMDLESLLQKLTNLVRDFLKVDICDVRIRHPDGARHVVASGIAVEKLLSDRGHGVVRWENYAAAKQVVRISDLNKQSDSASEQSTVRGLGVRGYVGAPFFSKDGSFLGVIRALTYVPRDFSQPEMDLIQQLANEVAVAIENAQLYRDLEKSDKVKTEFLGVMSHELRTPLNVIIGYTNLMLDGVLGEINPQMNDGLQKVTRQSKDLLSMVESIMEATKIESESVVVETHEVDLSNFLADLRSSYGAHIEKDVSLAWDYPSALPVIKTDSFKLAHIFHNLINNALKFTEAGKVTISARVVEHDAQRAKSMAQGDKRKEPAATATPSALPSALSDTTSYVQFSVSDTGIGMEEKDLTTIFDMFRQVDSSNTRLYGGAGLGLYIVKKFTEMLGGNVSVASEAGKGSTFTVRVPLS